MKSWFYENIDDLRRLFGTCLELQNRYKVRYFSNIRSKDFYAFVRQYSYE